MQTAAPPPDVTGAPRLSPRRAWVLVVVAIVVGATLTAVTLRMPRGSLAFYLAGLAQAGVWTAAAIAAGPVVLAARRDRVRDLLTGLALAVLAYVAFVGAAAVGRHIGFLAGPIDSILRKADAGPVALVLALALVNGLAEELFFRGVIIDVTKRFSSVPAALISVAVYTGVTAIGGNNALTAAALVMGALFAIERVVTRGLVVPIVTHLAWSTLMILALPR